MNTVITIYAHHAFKRYLLPAINDADYSLHIPKSLYSLERSITLQLEVINNSWRFVPSNDYDILNLRGQSILSRHATLRSLISGGESVLQLTIEGRQRLTLIVQTTEKYFSQFERLRLPTDGRDITIGCNRNNTISYNPNQQSLISNAHARILRQGNVWCICDLNSANGTFVNNRRITNTHQLTFGDSIDIFGLRIVYLGNEIAINLQADGISIQNGNLQPSVHTGMQLTQVNATPLETLFHRSPRQLSSLDTGTVEIDDAPPPRDTGHNATVLGAIGSSIAMALPMMLGCAFMIYASNQVGMSHGAFMLVGLVTAVASATIGVVRSLISIRKARLERLEYENMRNRKYGEYLHSREQIIEHKYMKNAKILRERYQSAIVVCGYNTENAALWSKNVSQPDFLTYRLGIGTLPFQVEIKTPKRKFTLTDNALAELPDQIKQRYATLESVPICVNLANERLVGVVDNNSASDGTSIVRALVAQIAANNSYTEVRLVFIYNQDDTDQDSDWSYIYWLPHVWNETRTFRYVATNAEEAREVFFELNRVLRERIEDQASTYGRDTTPIPHYLLVLAHPEFLAGELVSQYALNPEPTYGLTTIYLAERYEDLPNECSFIIENDTSFKGMYHATDNLNERTPITFDEISNAQVSQLAVNLANVRVRETQSGGEVPDSVTFFEMQGIQKPEELNAINLWRKNRTYESMRALIGQKAGGLPCYLDIHEKYHGPHGLVAGTTGSGKSETLQTFILSLSINFSPDDIGFFIIDYKGGGMANLFEGLPHLVGKVSNLSGNQVNRALVSIQSEKNRRESIFAEYGVKDIRDYTKLVKSGEATVPVPHLIIVIDEFAEMKNDEPEFIQEVISLSRVGRSLGIHLIMATQRPAGAVSEDIWANSRFKLCLRVQSKQDSNDMLRRPDAAYLTQSGRCYLQVGNDELFELFQSGYSGATYSADELDTKSAIATMLTANGSPALVGSHTSIVRQRERKLAWVETLITCVRDCGFTNPTQLESLSYNELETFAPQFYDQFEQRGIDYPKNDYNTEALISFLLLVGKVGFSAQDLVAVDDTPGNKIRLPQQPKRTQLEATVAYLRRVAKDNKYTRDYSLFLPLLPTVVSLTDLPQDSTPWNSVTIFNGQYWPTPNPQPTLAISLGIFDDPLNQRQGSFIHDFLRNGSMSIYGAPQTGKTTLLQTIMFNLVMRYSPKQVNIYVIEYSARRLSPLSQAPHVGGIVREVDEADKIDKLVTLLRHTINDRKNMLGDSSYQEYLATKESSALPAVVLCIDNYAALTQRTGDTYGTFFRKLVQEGAAWGIFVVATAGGVGSSEIPNSLAQEFRTVVCLELPNVYDYATYLRRNRLGLQPEQGVPGRGICIIGDRPLEFQTAISYKLEQDSSIANALRSTSQLMKEKWGSRSAAPIPSIPKDPTWNDFISLDSVQDMLADSKSLPYGWDAQLAEPCEIDLSKTYSYLISGAKRKGKTNAMRALMLSAKQKGGRVIAVDFSGDLKPFCKHAEIEFISNENEFSHLLKSLMPTIVERNQQKAALRAEGLEEESLFEKMNAFERIYLFVENLPDFVERTYNPKIAVDNTYDDLLSTVAAKCTLHNIFWFFTIDKASIGAAPSYALFQEFVKDHKGMHFGGQVYSTAGVGLSFDNHDRRNVDKTRPIGRAMLAANDDTTTLEVVVPHVRWTKAH